MIQYDLLIFKIASPQIQLKKLTWRDDNWWQMLTDADRMIRSPLLARDDNTRLGCEFQSNSWKGIQKKH